ncbi:MAG: tryptophan-rich sensory protein [Oscillospiraceae bacterium]|nr:tryptophan-rich sensory protein [Oscillospiraceae bacterium]
MKLDWKKLLLALAIPLGVGALSALLTGGSMANYGNLNRPPLSPPGWLFPVVWTILYLLMGYASYRIWVSDAPEKRKKSALRTYLAQLAVNFLWPLIFFGLQWRLLAFWVILLLWVLIYFTIKKFSKIDELAADLLLPYILWVTFAAYLNLGAFLLN